MYYYIIIIAIILLFIHVLTNTHTRHQTAVHQTHARCLRRLIKLIISFHMATRPSEMFWAIRNSDCREDVGVCA